MNCKYIFLNIIQNIENKCIIVSGSVDGWINFWECDDENIYKHETWKLIKKENLKSAVLDINICEFENNK